MKTSEIIKECRAEAKKVGLTFKRSNMNINSSPAYHFEDRASGRKVLEKLTIALAYNNVCSGFVGSYNKDKGAFDGISIY